MAAQGLIYFSHQFEPEFIEAGLLADGEMLAAATAINQQIHQLAPVLNQPSAAGAVTVESSANDVPVAVLAKRDGAALYVFAVAMRDGATQATFHLADASAQASVQVLGEDRTVQAANGVFADTFNPWDVHLYKIESPAPDTHKEDQP